MKEREVLNKVLNHCIKSKTNMQLIPVLRNMLKTYGDVELAEEITINDITNAYSYGNINFDGVIASLVLYF